MNDSGPVLVKFHATEHFIGIRTITRQRKSPTTFDLPRPAFTDLEAAGDITVKDGCSFARLRLTDGGEKVRIDFTWLSQYSDGAVRGYAQAVTLDYGELAGHIWDSMDENGQTRWSMLSIDRIVPRPRLDFSAPSAQKTIREVIAVPMLRHKLTRAVRDHFNWPNDGTVTVYFYADMDRYSFSFREVCGNTQGICGGLILHRYDGLEKAKYSVHT